MDRDGLKVVEDLTRLDFIQKMKAMPLMQRAFVHSKKPTFIKETSSPRISVLIGTKTKKETTIDRTTMMWTESRVWSLKSNELLQILKIILLCSYCHY